MGSYLSRSLSSYLRSAHATLRPSAWARRLPPPRPALRPPRGSREPGRGALGGAHPRRCAPPAPQAPPPLSAPLSGGLRASRPCRAPVPDDAARRRPEVALAPPGPLTLRIRGGARHPRRLQSPVTIQMAPPERRAGGGSGGGGGGSLYTCRADPCARDTVLRALGQCSKGRARFDGPLWFETPPDPKRRRRSPPRGRSAFAPVGRRGAALPLVPRPGPLLPVQPCGPEVPATASTVHPEPPRGAPHTLQARAPPPLPPVRATRSQPLAPENLRPEVATLCG